MADNIISEVELEMGISIEHLIEEFGKIRTGRANPSLVTGIQVCLLYTSPSPRDGILSRMPSSA